MSCPISQGNNFDCANPPVRGIQPRGIVLNFEDMQAATVVIDGTTKAITSITLPTGKQGYEYLFPKGSAIIPSSEKRAVDRGVDTYDHSFDAVAVDVSQVAREEIEKMSFTKVCWIVQRKDGKYELLGYGSGMRLTAFPYVVGEGLPFTTATDPDEPGENKAPVEIFDTDAATTDALIDSLLVPAV